MSKKKPEKVFCMSCRPYRMFSGINAAEYLKAHYEDSHAAKKEAK